MLEDAKKTLWGSSSPTLGAFLGDEPSMWLKELPKSSPELQPIVLEEKQRTGLTTWLKSKGWQLDCDTWLSTPEKRWTAWREQTIADWLADDWSGGNKDIAKEWGLRKNEPVLDSLCWDLGISSAEKAYGVVVKERAARAMWLSIQVTHFEPVMLARADL